MITGIEIRGNTPLVGGVPFGSAGAYQRIDGIATGTLDPRHPGNGGISLLDRAPRNGEEKVVYRTGFTLLQPRDPAESNGRLLFEVNNRGRIMLFANLCGGRAGNRPVDPADLGDPFLLRRGFSLMWSGWDPAAPKATGLWLDAPVIDGFTAPIREEFVSGTRLGEHQTFRLAYRAVEPATVTVRRTRSATPQPVRSETADGRTVRLLPEGTMPERGSIYEVRYRAADPTVSGVGFAATRDLVGHVRHHPGELDAHPLAHAIGFGISQAGRYLRDHIAGGFNADENGRRVFDGVFTHVAGVGRLFLNTPFAQPFRTRTRHEDRDFPEVAFPFSAAPSDDPLTGAGGALLRGDATDPKLIETNTGTEYWQKGASLLHTDPAGRRDLALPANVRGFLLAGTQHAGKANMPRDPGPCLRGRNWHDPTPALRALLLALDAWVADDTPPPSSRLPRIADGTLVPASEVAFPAIPGWARPEAANDVAPLPDWTNPQPQAAAYEALVPQVDTDGNERAGIRLPDIAVPTGTFTGWNLYAAPFPEGELADRDGSFLPFAGTDDERAASHDPRPSLAARYPDDSRRAAVRAIVERLLRDRLLLPDDAARYLEG